VRLALYREYRPRTFGEIIGQDHVTRTLRNALADGRAAHAYLFCGPRGTGKTSTARVLAKALSCTAGAAGEPCGVCETCVRIGRGEGLDVIEMDAASNRGIEEIRNLRERVRLAPVAGAYKVYVIDEVHMLTNEAANALLKTLEEPPAKVVFVLCTTEPYRLPATILSRCQRFDFHRLGVDALTEHLAHVLRREGQEAEPAALRLIARSATGSVRDALTVLEQCLAYSDGRPLTLKDVRAVVGSLDSAVLLALADAVLRGDVPGAWRALDELLSQGRDAREVTRGLGAHFRDVLLQRLAGETGEPVGPAADEPEALARQAREAPDGLLQEAVDLLSRADADMRYAGQPRLVLEARLVRLCGLASPPSSLPRSRGDHVPAAPPGDAAPPRDVAPPRAGRLADEPPGTQVPPRGTVAVVAETAATRRAEAAEPPPGPAAETAEVAPDVVLPVVPPPAAGPEHAVAPGQSFPLDLGRAWKAILARLPDQHVGLLDGAEAAWDAGNVCIWLPQGRDALAAYLGGTEVPGMVAEALHSAAGRRVGVKIEARTAPPGLFTPGGTADRRSGKRGGRQQQGRQPAAAGPAPKRGPEAPEGEDLSLLRQAQAMFRAEEVGKEE
jgi:DNA polymerase-3 subunit gamma/tau